MNELDKVSHARINQDCVLSNPIFEKLLSLKFETNEIFFLIGVWTVSVIGVRGKSWCHCPQLNIYYNWACLNGFYEALMDASERL
jgi:hypothetical protein